MSVCTKQSKFSHVCPILHFFIPEGNKSVLADRVSMPYPDLLLMLFI